MRHLRLYCGCWLWRYADVRQHFVMYRWRLMWTLRTHIIAQVTWEQDYTAWQVHLRRLCFHNFCLLSTAVKLVEGPWIPMPNLHGNNVSLSFFSYTIVCWKCLTCYQLRHHQAHVLIVVLGPDAVPTSPMTDVHTPGNSEWAWHSKRELLKSSWHFASVVLSWSLRTFSSDPDSTH